MDLHQRIQALRPADGVQIGLDRRDSGFVPGVPIQDVLVEVFDLLLRGALLGGRGGDLPDDLGYLPGDFIAQICLLYTSRCV